MHPHASQYTPRKQVHKPSQQTIVTLLQWQNERITNEMKSVG